MKKSKYNYVNIQKVNENQGWFTIKHGGDYKQLPIKFLPVIKTLLNKINNK